METGYREEKVPLYTQKQNKIKKSEQETGYREAKMPLYTQKGEIEWKI